MLVIALDTQFLDLGLTLGTLVPTVLGTLITANVDILGGEHLAQLAQNGLEEGEGFGVTATQHLTAYAPVSTHGIRTTGTAQVGEYVKGALHVAGEVNFGNYVDVAFCGIANHFAAVVLGIISAVRNTVIDSGISGTHHSLGTHTALGSQAGISLHLETPALVFGEVPVELVAAVKRHHINELLDELNRKEMAAAVQQYATVLKTGLVLDFHKGEFYHL